MPGNAMALLASYPRSGNTWLRSYIMALSLGAEAFRASYADLDGYVPSDTAPELYTGAGIDLEALDAPAILSRRDEMLRFVHDTMPNSVLKTHTMLATVRGTPSFSAALLGPVVYAVRNPLDIAPSLARLLGTTTGNAISAMNAKNHCRYRAGTVPDLWGNWSQNVMSWTGRKSIRVLTLRYEDMVSDPARCFLLVARHLRFTAGIEKIAEAIEVTQIEHLMALENAGQFRNPSHALKEEGGKFFGQGAARDFTEKLTPEQAATLIRAHAPVMARFGYLDDRTLDFARVTKSELAVA